MMKIDAPDSVKVVRQSAISGVAVEGAEGHIDVRIDCQFGTLTMSLEHMPTGCHINGSGTNLIATGGQQVDVNRILATLVYHYPQCYQPDSIVFQVTQPNQAADAEFIRVEVRVVDAP